MDMAGGLEARLQIREKGVDAFRRREEIRRRRHVVLVTLDDPGPVGEGIPDESWDDDTRAKV